MNENAVLTIKEAAAYLNVKTSWLYAHSRELPAIKVGHGLRFRRADLDAWLTSQMVGVRP